MNRDEIKGKTEAVKGAVKQKVGQWTDDPTLQEEGLDQEAAGKAQQAFGKAKRKVGEAVEEVGKAIKR